MAGIIFASGRVIEHCSFNLDLATLRSCFCWGGPPSLEPIAIYNFNVPSQFLIGNFRVRFEVQARTRVQTLLEESKTLVIIFFQIKPVSH